MIWPFRPHPPLPLSHKVANERRFAAVGRWLGRQRITALTALTPQDIDAIFTHTKSIDLPERLFAFCQTRLPHTDRGVHVSWDEPENLMINGQAVHYRFSVDSDGHPTALGIHPELAEFPYRLAAVIAAAAGEFLIHCDPQRNDLPNGAAEILPLFFGFGPVMANAALHEVSEMSGITLSSDASRVGTLSPLEFGYCMALADWTLDSGYSQTSSFLRLDAREGLENGLRFLRKTGDCSFPQDFLDHSADVSVTVRLSQLQGSRSVQLGTLMDLYSSGRIADEIVESIATLLGHREFDIQVLAALTLGRSENLPRGIHDDLVIHAEHSPTGLRRAAISAIRPGFDNDEIVLDVLIDCLRRTDKQTAAVIIGTLLKYDSHPETLLPTLLRAFRGMVENSSPQVLQRALQLLARIHEDPTAVLTQHFQDDPTALAILNELLGSEMTDGEMADGDMMEGESEMDALINDRQ